MTMHLTRQQRRAMQRLAGDVERATDGDRRFFERHPDRSYRVRLASKSEIAQREITTGIDSFGPDPTTRYFILVHQLAPGVRMRAYVPGPAEEAGEDFSENAARCLWGEWCRRNPWVRDREAATFAAMRLPGGPLHDGGAA